MLSCLKCSVEPTGIRNGRGKATHLRFRKVKELDKLYALFTNKRVELGLGAVEPATPSGRNRLIGKVLKFHTLLAYSQSHRKPHSGQGGGLRPGKYTMVRWEGCGLTLCMHDDKSEF